MITKLKNLLSKQIDTDKYDNIIEMRKLCQKKCELEKQFSQAYTEKAIDDVCVDLTATEQKMMNLIKDAKRRVVCDG
jgi:hypothetical protein